MTEEEIAALLRRLDLEPQLAHNFEARIAEGKTRFTVISGGPSGEYRNLSPDELRLASSSLAGG